MDAAGMTGRIVRWTYDDGPMKGKAFEHVFTTEGTVIWKEPGAEKGSVDSSAKYEFAPINEDAYAFSYLSGSGFTLTSIVDERAATVVSFASNDKQLIVQRGRLSGR